MRDYKQFINELNNDLQFFKEIRDHFAKKLEQVEGCTNIPSDYCAEQIEDIEARIRWYEGVLAEEDR